ncbi:hypothetical protein AK88_03280 [Plasmodium fragile]|uniref:Band 7 domain-containing protein n=1 Tax=Plasmodium fragile TaxID=5857 RepID=A0A0D9QK09_PLAFR|nr:uncharacterized protein AK88_03280 [Plasmodium fragile]KJP87112.1 hypothetical protein AK88_03280 [Plasmodium fragile]
MMAPNGGGAWRRALLRSYPWGRDNQGKLSVARSFYTQRTLPAMHASGKCVRSVAIATTHARGLHHQHRCTYYTSSDGKKYNKKIWNSLGIVIIPQQTAYIIERLGKYKKTLLAGIHFIIPFIDKIAYVFSLKEETITIPNQTAITKDNVTLNIDGVLYIKCDNPYNSSYGIEDAVFAVTQLAQVTMRSELGKLTLDATFLERDNLNEKIVTAINESAKNWGIKCMRYEIRDIILPVNIKNAMEKQAEAERKKRAEILQSEGERESEINIAIGKKKKSILIAEGQSFAIKAKADATAEAIEIISNKIKKLDSNNAISLLIAEQYIDVFANICKNNNTVIIPADLNNISSLISQSLSIYNNIQNAKRGNGPPQIESLPNDDLVHCEEKD